MKNLNKKTWINPRSTGYIYVKLEKDEGWWGGELKMGDCSRIVNFDIDVNNKKDRISTIRKLNIMISEIDRLVEAIGDIPND